MLTLYDKAQNDFITYKPIWGNIKLAGEDVVSFLQGQTSNNVDIEINSGQLSSILDAKARTLALIFLFRSQEKEYFVLAPNRSNQWLIEHLEKFIIIEDVSCSSSQHTPYFINGPSSYKYLQEEYSSITQLDNLKGQKIGSDYLCNFSFIGGEGYVLLSKNKHISIKNEIDKPLFDCLRLERGIPFYGEEFDEKNLLPETGLQVKVVDYNKGCFIGQEIVARVKSRGSVNRALIGFVVEEGDIEEGDLYQESEKIGKVINYLYSPYFKKTIACAFINRKVREKKGTIKAKQKDKESTITFYNLPFITESYLINEAKNPF